MSKRLHYDPMDDRFACCIDVVRALKAAPKGKSAHPRAVAFSENCKVCKTMWMTSKDRSSGEWGSPWRFAE